MTSPEMSINTSHFEARNNTPLTALGEMIYGPETLRQMVEWSAVAGHITSLATAVVGTSRLASVALGGRAIPGAPETLAPTQPSLATSSGGGV